MTHPEKDTSNNKKNNVIKDNALSLSGASIIVAEFLSILSGSANTNTSRAIAGSLGTLSSSIQTLFGQIPKTDRKETWGQKIGRKIYDDNKYLKKIPDKFRLDKNPATISYSVGVLAGLHYINSGLNSAISGEWEAARGAIITGTMLYMILTPEKDKTNDHIDNSENKSHLDSIKKTVKNTGNYITHPEKIIETVKNDPLKIGNMILGAASALALGQGISQHDPFIITAATAYFIADTLSMAFVKKNGYKGGSNINHSLR